ncbi:MAG: mevalonate kinase [bacterium]|nr:mevalonate kinase [bacterium]
MITVSAPGKLMILGEHAVVYGRPCLVTAVDQRLSVSAERSDDGKTHVDAPQVKETRFVDAAVSKFFQTKGKALDQTGVRLKIRSDFTHQVGFGSSSAVSVATLRALAILFDTPVDDDEIFQLAYDVTLDIQRVGSGFDIAAATYGGTIAYQKGRPVSSFSHGVPLIVGYTGTKADTPTLIREVAAKRALYPEKVERIFDAISDLVNQGKKSIASGDWELLGKAMNFTQEYLRDLGVSSEKLESMISGAKKAGAWGAKLSGAGGGDCMIAIAPEDKREDVENALVQAGGIVMDVTTHSRGVRVESRDFPVAPATYGVPRTIFLEQAPS